MKYGSDFVWRTESFLVTHEDINNSNEKIKLNEKPIEEWILIPKIDYHCHLSFLVLFFFLLSLSICQLDYYWIFLLRGKENDLLISKRMNIRWFDFIWLIIIIMVTCSLTIWHFFFLHFNGVVRGRRIGWRWRCNRHNDWAIRSTKAQITIASIRICANLIQYWIRLLFDSRGHITRMTEFTYSLARAFKIVFHWAFCLVNVWKNTNTSTIYANQMLSTGGSIAY